MSDTSERVSVLEVQMENVEKTVEKLDVMIGENYRATLDIKAHLAKQNGAIPHILEKVEQLQDDNKEFRKTMHHNAVQTEGSSIKTKILWGILGVVSAIVLEVALKLIFHV